MSNEGRVLIVGGTGYLGQHLLQGLAESSHALAFTHHSSSPPHALLEALPHALAFRVDLRTGSGLEDIARTFGQPDMVINCAAISVPRACEMDPEAAMAVNVPLALVKWLSSFNANNALLVHLSTDQVYEGTKSFYKEEDETIPVNIYGKSKLEAERYIVGNYQNFAILRSSIIYGPQTISPVPKSLPIQWMDSVLAKGEQLDFFHDEFRCPVFVKDLVSLVKNLTRRWISEKKQMHMVLNVGGPDRVSRVQMAEAVARVRGYDMSLIRQVSASSINGRSLHPKTLRLSLFGQFKVDRGVKSPADISMDVSKLIQVVGIDPTSYAEGVRMTLS